ncbi:rna-binding protein [Stylonychia lemnae]|uniref:Rna-binding protein n=1 Tax=Stylonychia lemnae TaxID=5949 RepID=A0A078AM69_STYLE|nr:rna-binding protein [Stylonychia lemnae]|eukprot:CDW83480.1 rna-binding protein [Stylonychia lemnae]
MDSENYYIEQLLATDDSDFNEQQNQKKLADQESIRQPPIDDSIFPSQNISQLGDYQGFQQVKSPPYTQTQQINKPIDTAPLNKILYEGTYTKIFNQFINEDVSIHLNCFEQIKIKGQAAIQNLLQSMIPKFSISFSIPNHQSQQQVIGQDVKAEIRFINPQTMNIINAIMNMKLQPAYDAVNGSWFCQQSIYSQFPVQTYSILIDLTLIVPDLPSKKVRGMINLYEILPMQSQPIVCLQVPLSSRNPMYTQGSMTDQFYLTFNVQRQKDEFLLSNIQFQIEFKDCNLFSQQQPQPIIQNQSHLQMQYPMQMDVPNMDPRQVLKFMMYCQNNFQPIQQEMMQSPPHIQPQFEAAFQGGKYYSYGQNHDHSQSAQLGNSGFKTSASPFYPPGNQYLDSSSAYSDNSSTMSSSQQLGSNDKMFEKYFKQQYKSAGLEKIYYMNPREFAMKMGYYIDVGNQQPTNNNSNVMSPIDSQTELSLSSKSQNSRKKKDSSKKLSALGLSQSSKQGEKKSSPSGSQVSSNTGKKNSNSKTPKPLQQQLPKPQSTTSKSTEIPHINNMLEYIVSQKGSRFMQQFVQKANLEQIENIIKRIQNDLGNLMIDKYGNYFCQNLLRTVNPQNRLKIISYLSPEFVKVSNHDVGTHSIQRLLEVVTQPEEKEVIFNAIKMEIEMMAHHLNGNYVLALALSILEQPHIEHIVEVLIPHIYDLSVNKQGICIVNKMITHTQVASNIQKIVEILSENLIQIIQDPFGNYAITQALQTWDEETCKDILKKFKKNFTQLAIQNFSQQVLEKCVERASTTLIKEFFEILQRENVMKSMMKNKHSIFIVQKIHQRLTTHEDLEMMRTLIQKNICYVNEKLIKSKGLTVFQAFIEPQQEIQSKTPIASLPNSGNHSRQPSGQGSPSLLK